MQRTTGGIRGEGDPVNPGERSGLSFQTADLAITRGMARYSPILLRLSLGIVFLWFGALKSSSRR